jgi:acylphosphatase
MGDSPGGRQKRLRALFSGRVQGVGMRATVAHLAREQELTGWVRNLEDGRVEFWGEGSSESLLDFLTRLRDTMGTFIREVEEDWGEADYPHENFQIRF